MLSKLQKKSFGTDQKIILPRGNYFAASKKLVAPMDQDAHTLPHTVQPNCSLITGTDFCAEWGPKRCGIDSEFRAASIPHLLETTGELRVELVIRLGA